MRYAVALNRQTWRPYTASLGQAPALSPHLSFPLSLALSFPLLLMFADN